MASEMQIIVDTLYSKGDLIIKMVKESKEVLPVIIEHTTETTNGCKTTAECLCSPAFFICCSLVIIAIVLLRYYRKKERGDWAKESQGKLFALKKEYQKMALDYLKEKKGECDVNKDAFITTINGYIADVESSMKSTESSAR